ncbi:MAG: ABC-F family ATP-binding cassette domain-containing protein, partial [Rhodospirillales bacterium]|nr:ABC-F family ATP-binding cassette domain-containing protein [Rhodospirillales bacterium]
MRPPLLHLQNIILALGTRPLLDGAELAVGAGERVCLVGRNGSGKSTLLGIAAGTIEAEQGSRFLQPGTRVCFLRQKPDLSGYDTILAYASADLGPTDDVRAPLRLLDALGLDPERAPVNLSGGEMRRAALARALAPDPDLLLLDEPTNHLDLPAIAWLEQELAGRRAGIVLISHDRRFLEALSRATIWLDRGRTKRMEQSFAGFEAWRDTLLAEEETARHREARKLVAEEDWLRYGVTARRKRNQKRLADLIALRTRQRSDRAEVARLRFDPQTGGLSGKLVAVAEKAGKSWGDRPIVRDLDLRILRGERVGIIGANGAGKTTLLGLLSGQLAPDTGQVTLGAALSAVQLDQMREGIDPTMPLARALSGGAGDTVAVGDQRRHVIGVMKDFLFRPEQAETPVGRLSGGERGRLMLALAFLRPSNLMLLDEPTNDLDLETLDLLQEQLAAYDGTVLLVSHDRDFLDRVATSVVVAEGDGRWQLYAGGYSDMLAQRGAPPGPLAAAAPARGP